jgi:uncharacterized membrane protein YphA (DoxX/SURF4 family)
MMEERLVQLRKIAIPFLSIIFSFFFFYGLASAHVKWFTEEEAIKAPIETIITPFFMITALVIAIALGLIPQIPDKMLHWRLIARAEGLFDRLKKHTQLILRVGVSFSLLLQITFQTILAPEIEISVWIMALGLAVAILLVIPHAVAVRLGAVGVFILFVEAVWRMGWFHMLDYIFYPAICFALLVQNSRYQKLGMPALYLGTGLSLCWVAVEKWVYHEMSLNVIENHNIPTFGFDPSTFVSLSAFIEFVVGYLLIVGLLNRFLALLLTGIFIMTTTIFGITEIVGHAIVHVILIIFILEGTGFYKPPVKMHERKMDQIIFVFLNFLFVLASFILLYYRFG